MITELYIENYRVELEDGVNFAITKTYEELENPTIINNDWSKTLEIPFSETNNKIFSTIFNVEREYESGFDNMPNVGVYFNPSKKAYFDIFYNNGLIMHGYSKLDKVNNVSGCYEVTLFGILGVTFNELKQCTFNLDKASQSEDFLRYYIPLPIAGNVELNKELVKASWNNENPILDIHDENIGITDIIGFAPDFHGYNEDFDSKSVTDGTKFEKLEDILNTKHSIDYGDVLLGDGLVQQQMREFRSKYQKPYVYVNKIWQLLVDKSKQFAEENENFYPIELDGSWFNPNNPYYTDLVLMCNDYIQNKQTIQEIETTRDLELEYTGSTIGYYTDTTATSTLDEDYLHFEFKTGIPSAALGITLIPLKRIEAIITFDNGYTVQACFISACQNTTVNSSTTIDNYVLETTVKNGEVVLYADVPIIKSSTSKNFNVNYTTYIFQDATAFDNAWYAKRFLYKQGTHIVEHFDIVNGNYPNVVSINDYDRYKDKFIITLGNIWNPDIKPFDVLLNYAKIYNLIWITDYENRVIRVLQRSEYFKQYTIEDWTDKVNTKNIFDIKQPTFDDKYINWNYEEIGTDLVTDYEKRNNIAYGTYQLVTENDFVNSSNDLFKDIQPFNMYSPTMTIWDSYYYWLVGNPITRYYTTEVYMDNSKDDKSANITYAFAFRCNNQPIDTRLGDVVYLTDDCEFETYTNTFCYHNFGLQSPIREDCITATTMPLLSFIDKSGERCCLFNIPMGTYFNKQNITLNNPKSIYDLFWNEYIFERYNPHNKVVTLQAYISPIEYSKFQFNHFIKINNTLFIVNKINDYSIEDGVNTTIELQTVRDISAYQKGVVIPYVDITPQLINITDNASTYNQTGVTSTVHVFSTANWHISNPSGSWLSFNVRTIKNNESDIIITRNPWVFDKLPATSRRTATVYIMDDNNKELGYFRVINTFYNSRPQPVQTA